MTFRLLRCFFVKPSLMKNIAYIESWRHIVFVFVCVLVSFSLYLLSRSMSSPDDKLSENIWFVWSRTSYGGDKWRCHAWSRTDTHVNIVLEFCEVWTEFAKMKMSSILIFLCKMFLKWISWFDLAAILWHFQRKRFGFDLICWKYILWHLFLSFPGDRVVFSIFEPNFGENWMGRAKNLTNI